MTVSHEDIMNRLSRGDERFRSIDKKLDQITTGLAGLPQMQADVAETKEIVEAWGAVKTAGKFLKWMAMIVASITAIAVGAKLGIQHVIGRYP